MGSENVRDGYQPAVPLPYIPGSPAQHRRPCAGVSVKTYHGSMGKNNKGAELYTLWYICFSPSRFDFANSNVNDEYLNKMNPHHLPDVVRANGKCSVNQPGHQIVLDLV